MKALASSLLLLFSAHLDIIAQTDTIAFLKDIESSLEKQSISTSTILTHAIIYSFILHLHSGIDKTGRKYPGQSTRRGVYHLQA